MVRRQSKFFHIPWFSISHGSTSILPQQGVCQLIIEVQIIFFKLLICVSIKAFLKGIVWCKFFGQIKSLCFWMHKGKNKKRYLKNHLKDVFNLSLKVKTFFPKYISGPINWLIWKSETILAKQFCLHLNFCFPF